MFRNMFIWKIIITDDEGSLMVNKHEINSSHIVYGI